MADQNLDVVVSLRDNLSNDLRSLESRIIRFVGAASSAFTALSAIAFPVAASAQYQKQLLEAAKTTNYTSDEVDKLRVGLDRLSTQVNITAVDLAVIAAQGGQLGIGAEGQVDALLKFTEAVSYAVSALDVAAEEAVTSLGKIFTLFNVHATDYNNIVSAFNEVSNASTAASETLFDVVRRIGNLGGSVDFPQAAALAGSMIDLGFTAETAGTTLSKVFSRMKAQAGAFATFVSQNVTVSVEEWVKLLEEDGIAALQKYIRTLNNVPTNIAAAMREQLTGGGRIGEAVNKLQQQQARSDQLAEESLRLQNRLKDESLSLTYEETQATQERIAALDKMSRQTNVLVRLTDKAKAGYESGTSAILEQQKILSGLIAKWQVFANNINSVARSVGDVLIPPFTAILSTLSEGLDDTFNKESLKQSMEGIVQTLRVVGATISSVVSMFGELSGSTGMDWGAFLNMAALLAGVGAIKLFISLLQLLGAAFLATIPGVGKLASAFQKVDASVAQIDRRLNGDQPFRKGLVGIQQLATNLLKIESLNRRVARGQNALTAAYTDLAAKQTTFQNTFTSFGPLAARYRNVAALTQLIFDTQQNLNRAIQQGNTRSAVGYDRRLRQLNAIYASLQTQQGAIDRLNAYIARMSARIAGYERQISSTGGIATKSLLALNRTLTNFGPTVQNAFDSLRRAFASSSTWSSIVSVARATGTAISSALAPYIPSGVQAAFVSFFRTLRSSAVTTGDAIRTAFRSVASLPVWGPMAAGIKSVTLAAGGLISRIGGVRLAWLAAEMAITKGAVAVVAAISAIRIVTVALGAVMKTLIGAALFATMAKFALEFFGLWDGVAKAIANTYEALGGDAKNLPDFLKTKENLRAAAVEADTLNKTLKDIREHAAQFTESMGATLVFLREARIAMEELTFNPEAPDRSINTLKEGMIAITTANSKLIDLAARRQSIQKEYNGLVKEEENTLGEIVKANATVAASASNADKTARLVASLRATNAEMADLAQEAINVETAMGALTGSTREASEIIKDLQQYSAFDWLGYMDQVNGVTAGMDVLANAAFNAKEAEALFGTQAGETNGKLVQLAEALRDVARANREKLAASELGAGKESDVESKAAAERAASALAEAELRAQSLRAEINSLVSSRSTFASWFDDLAKSAEKGGDAIVKSMRAMQEYYRAGGQFTGAVLPKISTEDLLSTAAVITVTERAKQMYAQWAAFAEEAAERAKNAVSASIGEAESRAIALSKFIEDVRASLDARERVTSGEISREGQKYLEEANELREIALKQVFKGQPELLAAALRQGTGGVEQELNNLERSFNVEVEQIARTFAGAPALMARAIEGLGQKYSKLATEIQNKPLLKKAEEEAKQLVAKYDTLVKRVGEYKKRMEEANKVLADPGASAEEKAGALTKRQVSAEGYLGALDNIKKVIGEIEGQPPIGGEFVTSTREIEAMLVTVEDLTNGYTALDRAGADLEQQTWQGLASKFQAVAQQHEGELISLRGQFERYADAAKMSMSAAAEYVEQNVQKVQGLRTALDSLNEVRFEGLANIGDIDLASLEHQIDVVQKKLAKPVDLNVNVIGAENVQGEVGAAIRKAFDLPDSITLQRPVNITNVSLSDGALNVIKARVENDTPTPKLKIDPVINWSNVNKPTGALGNLLIFGKKDGGEIRIPRFANSGHVKGPGDSRSDSILAMLSNGEYVSDAITTMKFSPAFFAWLKEQAHQGTSHLVLQQLGLRRLATGGPATPAPVQSSLAQVASDFTSGNPPVASRHEITLNGPGNQKATLYGERQQVESFINILKRGG